MKAKNVLIFGCSGQIGRSIVRKLTKDNYTVTAVTRNIHQKGIVLKTLGNAGFINIVEANIFDETKIRELFKKADICINLVGILYEQKKGNTFKNIHTIFPSLLSKLSKEYKLKHFIHLSALGVNDATDSLKELAKSNSDLSEALTDLIQLRNGDVNDWNKSRSLTEDDELSMARKKVAWGLMPAEASELSSSEIQEGLEVATSPQQRESLTWWKLSALVREG